MKNNREDKIQRQHSQEMAIRWIVASGEKATEENLKKWTDFFQKDIGPVEEDDPTDSWGQFCASCGSKMIHKKGVNEKTAKPWAGWFCTENPDHTPRWERNVT